MSDQPKPTEWTAKYVASLSRATDYGTSGGHIGTWQSIADAHNAALAANDHKWNLARLKDIKEITDRHAQQLAAERERNEKRYPVKGRRNGRR